MLAALARGVKGGKWYSLIDKLYPEDVLGRAFARVAANRGAAGVDHVSVARYARDLDANLRRLSEELRTGSYRPQAIRRHYIPKPGSREMRPLGRSARPVRREGVANPIAAPYPYQGSKFYRLPRTAAFACFRGGAE
jgi:hypothetical protein